jgi:putative ABC transport system ATP-binding protein
MLWTAPINPPRPARRPLPAVVCRGVVKTYGARDTAVTALRGVDLRVETGQTHMLVGPSGCGKTTLISVVAGILDPDQGTCRVFGQDFQQLSGRERTRVRGQLIGFVFQQFNLLPTLSAEENVSVPLLLNGARRSAAIAQARDLLDHVGLGEKCRVRPAQLSGGQQQRVAIARALVHGPRLIVCDEPTSALDHETGHKVMELLKRVAVDRGRSLLIVTHDARIFGFADRISRMDDGRVVGEETPTRSATDRENEHAV